MCLASAALAGATVPSPAIDYLDLTDDYAAFWASSQTMDPAERPARFRAYFAKLLPGFYDPSRNSVDPALYDKFIASSLRAYPKQRAGIDDVSRRFASLITPALADFEKRVGPVGRQRVVLLHSMGEMDGGVRTLQGRRVLVFGADRIAELHGAHRIQPFFHHELFHQYHARRFAGCEALWCSLWSEGLAVHAAHLLTPDATDGELLLNVPEPIRAAVDARRNLAVCTVVAKLDSTAATDFAGLFQFQRQIPDLPPRFGYYVGYLAAREAGRTRSLKALAALDVAEARPLVEQALQSLERCPTSATAKT